MKVIQVSHGIEYNKYLNDLLLTTTYGTIAVEDSLYVLGKAGKDEPVEFYQVTTSEKHSFFGTPFEDIKGFCTIDNKLYLCAGGKNELSNHGVLSSLYDVEGNLFTGYGGKFVVVDDVVEYKDATYIKGIMEKEDGSVTGDVFGPGGSIPFGRFNTILSLYVNDSGELEVIAKRKEKDDLFHYGIDDRCTLDSGESFYRVAKVLKDQSQNNIYACQKEREDSLHLYDDDGNLLFGNTQIDDVSLHKLGNLFIRNKTYLNLTLDDGHFNIDGVPTEKKLERLNAIRKYHDVLNAIEYLDVNDVQKESLMMHLEIVIYDIIDRNASGGLVHLTEILGSRLKSMADTLGNYHGFEMIHFMGAS